jgi:hypothetical protein
MSAVAKGPPVPAPFFPQHTAPVVIADPRYSPAAGEYDRLGWAMVIVRKDSPELAAVRAMAGETEASE